jgi:hypothetical protein
MNAPLRRSIISVAGILVLAIGMLFAGCSKSPVQPVAETSQPQVLGRSVAFDSDASGSPIPLYAEAVISGDQGGQLALFDVVLDIPPGALPVDTLYSIEIPDINVFCNKFGTEGLVFDAPLTVTMSYRGADLSNINQSTIRIGWWDEDNGEWVDMECELDQANQTVTGKLHHFSAYALVSD